MRWPKDTFKEIFHADVDDGGLDIPELQKRVLLMQEARLTRLLRDDDPAVVAHTIRFLQETAGEHRSSKALTV